ncbi:MAG: CoB--CoM heterodisulfide reductase iron-sulfur subunit A family protein [Candidatus Heimdallarchaeota archaeon]|nr:CoB--CoM heterodisulfide reductase iron-sulfur subunit A family protein [Candidatus Heimdallarchaeota archaeon]
MPSPENKKPKKRIGVFVCHCGKNIAETVDVERVAKTIKEEYPDVVFSTDNHYLCSEPGQKEIQDAIRGKNLESFICACCSPSMHEATFRSLAEKSGLNPYQVEIANIREQCSWVHSDIKEGTEKAIKIVGTKVEKVAENESLTPISVDVNKDCLVIGGGITGIQAALDLADAGYKVTIVERAPYIGGHMAQLSVTFPTLDCSQCILSPKTSAVAHHKNIELITTAEVVNVSGFVGNFSVDIKKTPRYVDSDLCNICGECEKACPVIVPSEYDSGIGPRKAIYLPFAQAVPSTYVLDADNCLGIHPLVCSKCKDVCEQNAINYDMQPEIITRTFGVIIVATGYDLYNINKIPEYAFGPDVDVIDSLQFERMLYVGGPTNGKVLRPSDHKKPETVVFVQCVGSRDPEHHMAYCSKICCTYTGKHAMLMKKKDPNAEVYVFYIDIRAAGRGYEEFIQRAQEMGVVYIRGKPSKIFRDGDKTKLWVANTLTGERLEVEADLVVLAPAIVPSKGTKELANVLKASLDEYGFYKESHMKLRPVESYIQGILIAGVALSPKDIPESVAQGSAAASKAMTILAKPKLEHEPIVATVNSEVCVGCKVCQGLCPYDALSFDNENNVSVVNEVLCEGCGTCVSACPTGALSLKNYSTDQLEKMIKAALRTETT